MRVRPLVTTLAVIGCSLSAVTPASHAATPSPDWADPTASVRQDPEAVVDMVPKTDDLQVVVTTETPSGPAITTTPVDDREDAVDVVDAAQDKDTTLAVSVAQPVETSVVNDPKRPVQWALNLLSAESLWSKARGSGVTVAIIDTGVQGTHPDLGSRVLPGFNVVTAQPKGDVDVNGHGTHVAGIVAATVDNGVGVAGLAPNVTILPVRVVDARGQSNTGYLAEAVLWAANHGAQVISISMGGTGADPNLNTAIQYAISRNVVVVAAVGNERLHGNRPHYPAAYSGVIGVGASDASNRIASFSNVGTYVDVVAPGVSIWSTYTTSAYASLSGTSMASPFVAATAALMISELSGQYLASKIGGQILSTARDLGTVGRDNTFGYGVVLPIDAMAVAAGERVGSTSTVVLPKTTIRAGEWLRVGGRLMTRTGANLAGKKVLLSATYNGAMITRTVTTNSQGIAVASFTPSTKAIVRMNYAGDASSGPSASGPRPFSLVVPRMKIARSKRTVTVTNYNLYGQKITVQKYSGGKWKTYKTSVATKRTRKFSTGKGTFRIKTSETSKLRAWTSSKWKTK